MDRPERWLDERTRDRLDMIERLRWAHPDADPIAHQRSAAYVADLTAWARLGRR